VDFFSYVTFFSSWANQTRNQTSEKPCHDRTLLSRKPTAATSHPGYKVIPKQSAPPANFQFPPTTLKQIKFTQPALEALKLEASKNLPEGKWVSTNDALVSNLWKAITIARGLPSDKSTTLVLAIDGRTRLLLPDGKPMLPKNYFGNVIFYASISETAGKVQSEPLSYLSSLVREKVAETTSSSYLLSTLDYLHSVDISSIANPFISAFFGSDLGISDWSKSSLYDVDFGSGGPESVQVPEPPVIDGIVSCLLGRNLGREVWVGLRSDHFAKLP